MKKINVTALLLAISVMIFSLVGCADNTPGVSDTTVLTNAVGEVITNAPETGEAIVPSDVVIDTGEMFSNRDKEIGYSETDTPLISLSDNATKYSGNGIVVNGNTVNITSEGTYVISGTLSDGQIIVEAADTDKIQLVLSGVSINCNTNAAIYVKSADKVFITLANGSTNKLTNKSAFVTTDENNVDAVIFAKSDLTLNGLGTLEINAVGGHGIVSKDDLAITSGNYIINADSHALSGKDSVRIADGSYVLKSGKDGIHSENTDNVEKGFVYIANGDFDITAGYDGIDASMSVLIENGTYKLTTGGGSAVSSSKPDSGWGAWGGFPGQSGGTSPTTSTTSAKGIKSDGTVTVSGGTFDINSSDDSIHSNTIVYINGGKLTMNSGDDGIHANTQVVINGGEINLEKSYEGIEGQRIDITGGIISVVASDDGLNAAGGADGSSVGGRPGMGGFDSATNAAINITGGRLTVNADGDGVDSNGSLNVSGGETYVSGPTNNGNGPLDYAGDAKITGGIFIAAGSSGMAQNFGSSSTQGSILYVFTSSQSAGKTVTLNDASGNTIVSYTPEKVFDCILISAPGIEKGATYTVNVGSTSNSVTMTSLIYSNKSGGMGGGPGGNKRP